MVCSALHGAARRCTALHMRCICAALHARRCVLLRCIRKRLTAVSAFLCRAIAAFDDGAFVGDVCAVRSDGGTAVGVHHKAVGGFVYVVCGVHHIRVAARTALHSALQKVRHALTPLRHTATPHASPATSRLHLLTRSSCSFVRSRVQRDSGPVGLRRFARNRHRRIDGTADALCSHCMNSVDSPLLPRYPSPSALLLYAAASNPFL